MSTQPHAFHFDRPHVPFESQCGGRRLGGVLVLLAMAFAVGRAGAAPAAPETETLLHEPVQIFDTWDTMTLWSRSKVELTDVEEGMRKILTDDLSRLAVKEAVVQADLAACDVVVVPDRHDVPQLAAAVPLVVGMLAGEGSPDNQVDVALEFLPLGFDATISQRSARGPDASPAEEVLAKVKGVSTWPTLGYESAFRDPRLRGVSIHGFYPGPSKGNQPQASRLPPAYASPLTLLAKRICRSASSRMRKLVILVGSAHLCPPDDCVRVLREAGFTVGVVGPLLEDWESALQHRFGSRADRGWLQLGDHVFRAPWLTNVTIIDQPRTFEAPKPQRPCPDGVFARLVSEGSDADTRIGLYVDDTVSRLRERIFDDSAAGVSRLRALFALNRLAEVWSAARSTLVDVALSGSRYALPAASGLAGCGWSEGTTVRIRQALRDKTVGSSVGFFLALYLGDYLEEEPAVADTLVSVLQSRMSLAIRRRAAIVLANYGHGCAPIRDRLMQVVADPDPTIARAVRLALDRSTDGTLGSATK